MKRMKRMAAAGMLLVGMAIAHGPSMPPDPWDGVKVAHGPSMPPDPWDGAKVC